MGRPLTAPAFLTPESFFIDRIQPFGDDTFGHVLLTTVFVSVTNRIRNALTADVEAFIDTQHTGGSSSDFLKADRALLDK